MADPRPLEELTPQQLKAVKASILTEHFGWSPETFAKQGMDLANVALYAATQAIEESLLEKAGPPHNLDEDEIQRGIYRLETLLESCIDRNFDMYELYVLRNTFQFPSELVPHMVLKHQEHIDESLRDTDQQALDEYETELRLYEAELEKERALAAAAEFVRRNLEDVQERAKAVGYMSSADPLSSRTQGVVSQLSLLQDCVGTLLDTPQPRSNPVALDPSDLFNNSRATYINSVASSKVDTLPRAGGADASRQVADVAAMTVVGDAIARTGGTGDAEALQASLGHGS